MDKFSFSTIAFIILIITSTVLLLIDLYAAFNSGSSIIKVKTKKGLAVFWAIILIIWTLLLLYDIHDYLNNSEISKFNSILLNIFWIEFALSSIIKSLKNSEIRENGVYNYGAFYKWSRIQKYSWISPDKITFKVGTAFNNSRVFSLAIKEDFKPKVEEVLQRNFSS